MLLSWYQIAKSYQRQAGVETGEGVLAGAVIGVFLLLTDPHFPDIYEWR